jgi:hypothetical protein
MNGEKWSFGGRKLEKGREGHHLMPFAVNCS